MDIGIIIFCLIMAAEFTACIWVYLDARAIGGDLINEPSVFEGKSSTSWAFGCFLMFAWTFPAYLTKRQELKRRVADYHALPDEYKWK